MTIKLIKNRISIFVFFVTLIPVVVMAETGKAPDAQAAKRGVVIFEKYCVACHGKKGIGGVSPPPMLRGPGFITPPTLSGSGHTWHHTDKALLKTILEGSPRPNTMPAWKGTITTKQARDVLDYVKSLWPERSLKCQGPNHMSCK